MDNLIQKWKKDESAAFAGWDFSYLRGRVKEQKLPWNYNAMAKKLVGKSSSVLDMGTGGGEIFSSFAPFPEYAVATEGWKPNVAIAKKRLEPLGVKVVAVNESSSPPFKDEDFDLVLNRHDAFNAKEVFRVLKPGGTFLTQQVSGDNLKDLSKQFSVSGKYKKWNVKSATNDIKKAGFEAEQAREWKGKIKFRSVGAIVYFLKAIPWIVPGFSVEINMEHLEKLQNRLRNGRKLVFTQTRFLVLATKP